MTAIYAYASKKNKFAVLAADNMESISGTFVDKIYFLENRYAVGICGLETIIFPISAIDVMSGYSNYVKHSDVYSLAHEIANLAEFYCENTQDEYLRKPDNRKKAENNPVELIILDYEILKLYSVNIGVLYPSENIEKEPIINQLDFDEMHLFALAVDANNNKKSLLVDEVSIMKSPKEYFENKISIDKNTLSGAIGDLGSIFISKNKLYENHSCFPSSTSFLSSFMASKR